MTPQYRFAIATMTIIQRLHLFQFISMNPRQTIDEIGHKEVLDNAVKVSNEDGHDT